MNKKLFGILITLGIVIALGVMFSAIAVSSQNKAINLEEQISESSSAIDIQEKRRTDLVVNLVDTVQNYDKHEQSTHTQLSEARSSAAKGNIKEAQLTIQAVTEAYPELKSIQNYQTLMNELATTENLIAEYRNNFNIQVKAYNKHIRKFPNSLILNALGYEKINVAYLEYDASLDAPTNLFDGE